MKKLKEKVYCRECKNKTWHEIIQEHKDGSSPEDEYQWSANYYIVQCRGCDTLAFVREYSDEDHINYGEYDKMEWYNDYYVYPEPPVKENDTPKLKSIEPQILNEVPDFIYGLYNQVVQVFNLNYLILCAVGLRTIIEALCKDVGIVDGLIYDEQGNPRQDKKGNYIRSSRLVGRINGLVEKGFIAHRQAKVLHQVRELGNYAVHEVEEPTRRTLKQGIEIIELLLINVYELNKYDIAPKKQMTTTQQ
jgi:hypothetical protein